MIRPHTVATMFLLATAAFLGSFTYAVEGQGGATEAAAGFDNQPVPGFFPGTATWSFSRGKWSDPVCGRRLKAMC